MGQLANDIFAAAGTNIPAAPTPTGMGGPALLRVFAAVETAVGTLELLTRGAHILRTAGRPDDAADGADGDLALNTANADLYAKAGGAWALVLNLRGVPGKDAAGQAGQSAYQLAVQQGFAGTIDQWLASLGRAGADGKSAYAVATANGFVGTVSQWLASLKGDAAAAAQLPPDSVTNSLLGPDVKVGSLSAASNAYPTADRASLTTVEKFLVWLGGKVTGLITDLGSLAGRVQTLESHPASSGGGSGTAYTLPQATASALGGVKSAGGGLIGNVLVNTDGSMSTPTPGPSLPAGGTAGQLLAKIDATDGNATWITFAGGAPAPTSGNQTAGLLKFTVNYQTRAASTGNIVLGSFTNVALGLRVRLELNPSNSTDQFLFGGYTVTGVDNVFQATINVDGSNQTCTFYDLGGPFVGAVKNILNITNVGTNVYQYTLDPLV